MTEKKDYRNDLAEIRSMMERSSRFTSLAGWAGIMAGIYALVGTYIAYTCFRFDPTLTAFNASEAIPSALPQVVLLALAVLALSAGTAFFLSWRRASSRSERPWNPTSRRLLTSMAVPMASGGIFALVLLHHGLVGLLAPLTLVFYGLALFSAASHTYKELRILGLADILLGLAGALYIEYSLLLWAAGFGLLHIAAGLYIHLKHER